MRGVFTQPGSLADLDNAHAQTQKAAGRGANELWDGVGCAINPLMLHGQTNVTAEIAQGVGQALQALLEESYYEPETGQLLATSFMDYEMPRADTLPFQAAALSEVPAPSNRLGVRSGGEGGTTPALAAVINAIVDTFADLRVPTSECRRPRAGVACHSGWTRSCRGVMRRRGSIRREAFSMNEQALRKLIAAVKADRVSRRSFMVGLGLTVPFASQLLAHAGLAQSPWLS
jgi:hypothetical protein